MVLRYKLEVPFLKGPGTPYALWEGNLFTGAVADMYARRGFAEIEGRIARR